ncbi:hypothetical protein CANARDRAFT_30614 [[Candida] arabinofermentans NRRL YB-2248]|uniref:Uncharacterized protein n=1 Tax=[Candida] arabinofermentans NRRL YB-2248 TaxID=983967 RepID=A0A1E4ST60_9ASCO|nr:hypothetical protein CANARDRAFT_30614 [[Candida] arabinofermentans NRRL YB-2248]
MKDAKLENLKSMSAILLNMQVHNVRSFSPHQFPSFTKPSSQFFLNKFIGLLVYIVKSQRITVHYNDMAQMFSYKITTYLHKYHETQRVFE